MLATCYLFAVLGIHSSKTCWELVVCTSCQQNISSAVVMRSMPKIEIYRSIKCHSIIYRVLVKYHSIPYGTSFVHIFVMWQPLPLYHRLSNIKEQRKKKEHNYKSNFFICQEIRKYTGIMSFFWLYIIVRHFLTLHITKQAHSRFATNLFVANLLMNFCHWSTSLSTTKTFVKRFTASS